MGRLTKGSVSAFNDASQELNTSNNLAIVFLSELQGAASILVGVPAAIATLSTSILGSWLVKSAYDDAKKAYSGQ